MNNKINYIFFGIGIFVIVIYTNFYRLIPDEFVYVGIFGSIALSSYVVIFAFYLVTVRHYEFFKSLTYRDPLVKIMFTVSRKKSFRADVAWFYVLGVLVNSLITFFLGIAPAKSLVGTVPLIGQILGLSLENVGIVFDPSQINLTNYPSIFLPFSSIGFVIVYVLRLHFHRVSKNKQHGSQALLILIYSTISLIAITGYAVYSDVDAISHISIGEFRELLGSVMLISFVFGSASSLTIIFIDRFIIQKIS